MRSHEAWQETSFSSLLLCARITSSHVVDLFLDRSAFVSKSASFWSDGPDLSKPALYQHCHSLDLVALKGHLVWPVFAFWPVFALTHPDWPGTESALASVLIFTQRKKFESWTLENISMRVTRRVTSLHWNYSCCFVVIGSEIENNTSSLNAALMEWISMVNMAKSWIIKTASEMLVL